MELPRRTATHELTLPYMTWASLHDGQTMSIRSISKRLSKLPLLPVLSALAAVVDQADRSMGDTNLRADLAKSYLRPDSSLQKALIRIRQDQAAALSSQPALTLSMMALQWCPEQGVEVPRDLRFKIGDLILAVGDHLSSGRGKNFEDMILEVVRASIFYRVEGLLDSYSTAYQIFFEVIPDMTDDHEFIDPATLLERSLGLTQSQVWVISAAFGIHAASPGTTTSLPRGIQGISDDVLDLWYTAFSQTTDTARSACKEDLSDSSHWLFSCYYARPVIQVSTTERIIPRAQFLAHKATTIGMYQTIWDLLRPNGMEAANKWSRFFGRAVEEHGRRTLKQSIPQGASVRCPEKERDQADREKACDVLVASNGDLLALDFVHRVLTKATQTTGTIDDLDGDIEKAVIKKLRQIDATLSGEINDSQTRSRFLAVVVISGHLPLNPMLQDHIEILIGEQDFQVLGRDHRCRPVGVIDLDELAMLQSSISDEGATMFDLLDEWLTSEWRGHNFRTWLVKQPTSRVQVATRNNNWETFLYRFMEGTE